MLERLQTDWWRALFESTSTVPRNPRPTSPEEVSEILSLTPENISPHRQAGLFLLVDGTFLILTWHISDGYPECLSVHVSALKEGFRSCVDRHTLAHLGQTAGAQVILKKYISEEFRYMLDEEAQKELLSAGIDPWKLEEFPRHDPRFIKAIQALKQRRPSQDELLIVPIIGTRYSIVRQGHEEQVVEPFEFTWVDAV